MTTEITKHETGELAESELIDVLRQSLYVGAKYESAKMVLSYCKAAHLDPMQKPVHIVPMQVKNPQTGRYEWQDTIMPGIGLYRIQADRSGRLAGISEPEFGPLITEVLRDKTGNEVEVTYPEWCRITVKKLLPDGSIGEFTALEYWKENYATDSRNSTAPNAMWRKRVRGQLAKCAESQALRKAFPEIGSAPTAEEMEGKVLEEPVEVDHVNEVPQPEFYPDDRFEEHLPKWEEAISQGIRTHEELIAMIETRGTLTKAQRERIKSIPVNAEVSEECSQ